MADLNPASSTLSANFAPYVYDMLSRGQGLASLPFQEYTGERFAGPSALQSQAFQGLAGLSSAPSQFGTATEFATQAGQGAAGITSALGGIKPVESYMSPYMQNVVDIQKREAERDAAKAASQLGGKFAQSGAFGGGRMAIESAELGRNLQQRLGDIQSTGLQSAFDRAMQQRLQEGQLGLQGLQQQLGAGQTLGSLGAQQQQAGLQGLQAQLGAGETQRQIAQQPLDFGYQQFQESLQDPYKKTTFMQSLLQGMPLKAPEYNAGQSGLMSALQGGLSGLALYKSLFGG